MAFDRVTKFDVNQTARVRAALQAVVAAGRGDGGGDDEGGDDGTVM